MYSFTQNRLTPLIKSGNLKLEINETVCFFSTSGLDIHIPVQGAGLLTTDAQIQFRCAYNSSKKAAIKSTVAPGSNILKFELINFTNSLPAGVTEPIIFTIGGSTFQMIFSGCAIITKANVYLITLHISIFSGAI